MLVNIASRVESTFNQYYAFLVKWNNQQLTQHTIAWFRNKGLCEMCASTTTPKVMRLSDTTAGCARCTPTSKWKRVPIQKRTKEKPEEDYSQNGFEEGLEVEAILGTRDSQNGIYYLIKWKEREDLQLLPALLTFNHVPSLVLHFYAQRVSWIDIDD